jgi:hypothetical protein
MRFENLRETLLTGGIAPRHVRRYLCELDDHLADLTAAQQAAGHGKEEAQSRAQALLGQEQDLAAAMLAQPGLKSLAARAPWLVFGIVPPLAIVAAVVIAVMPLVLLHMLLAGDHTAAPLWYQQLSYGTAFVANLVLGPGLAALLMLAAYRQRLNRAWPLLAVLLITVTAMHMSVYFPPDEHHGGSIGIGPLLLVPAHARPALVAHWPLLVLQFLMTLAPALWLLRKDARLRA